MRRLLLTASPIPILWYSVTGIMEGDLKDHAPLETFSDRQISSADDPEKHFPSTPSTLGGFIHHDLRLDPNGLPLSPQPSRFKDDPLVSLISLPRQRTGINCSTPELAIVVEMGRSNPSGLHGFPGSLQCSFD